MGRKAWLIIVAGLAVGIAVGWFFVMSSAWSEKAVQEDRLAQTAERSGQLQLSADEQDNLRAALPEQIDRRVVQSAVESAARAAQLYPTAISVTPIARGPRGATIRVSVLGTPAGLKTMLTRLSASLEMRPGSTYAYAASRAPTLTVDGVDVRALPGANRIQATVTLTAYRFVPGR